MWRNLLVKQALPQSEEAVRSANQTQIGGRRGGAKKAEWEGREGVEDGGCQEKARRGRCWAKFQGHINQADQWNDYTVFRNLVKV